MARRKPTCGFELEYALDYDLRGPRYKLKSGSPKGWGITREYAIGRQFTGTEIISPVIRDWKKAGEELETIFKKMAPLRKASQRHHQISPIGSETSQHVHIGIRKYTEKEIRKLIINFIKAEEYFFLHSPGRRKSGWCRPVAKSEAGRILLAGNSPDYRNVSWYHIQDEPTQAETLRLVQKSKINHLVRYVFQNKDCAIRFSSFGTIEFRMALSSENAQEVLDWAQTCQNFVHEFTQKDFRTRTQFLDLIPEGKLKRRIHAAMGL